jgi:uracil permease
VHEHAFFSIIVILFIKRHKMIDTNSKTKKSLAIKTSLLQLLALVSTAFIFARASNMSLANILIAVAITSIIFILLNKGRIPLLMGASFTFLPALILLGHSGISLDITSSATAAYELGGIIVSVWIVGLIYIIVATLIRFTGIKRMRRFFAPGLAGVLLIVVSILIIPRIFMFTIYEPVQLLMTPLWKISIIAGVSFMFYIISTSLFKSHSFQQAFSLTVGILSGLLAAILLDSIELLWLSKDILNTIVFAQFGDGGSFSFQPIVIFEDVGTYFGFWQYLHFDARSLTLIVPLSILSLSLHLSKMTAYTNQTLDVLPSPRADSTLVGEGLGILLGGLLSGHPMTVSRVSVEIVGDEKKSSIIGQILVILIILILGIFTPFTSLLGVIPLAAVGGVLIGYSVMMILRGVALLWPGIASGKKPQWRALAIFTLALGLILGSFELMSDYIGNDSMRIVIGGLPIPSLLIVIVAAFIFNSLFPQLDQ